MIKLYYSSTEKITDILATFNVLNNLFSEYQKTYEQYEIKMFFSDGRKRKLICNLAAVIEYLSNHDADYIFVYGLYYNDKYLLIEKDFDNFLVFHES